MVVEETAQEHAANRKRSFDVWLSKHELLNSISELLNLLLSILTLFLVNADGHHIRVNDVADPHLLCLHAHHVLECAHS